MPAVKIRGAAAAVADQPEILSTSKLTDARSIEKALWHYKGRRLNEKYEAGIKQLPKRPPPASFDACLIHHNYDRIDDQNKGQSRARGRDQANAKWLKKRLEGGFSVRTESKWLTDLGYYTIDAQTGEILTLETYETNDFKRANKRKITGLKAFADAYQALYAAGRISCLFLTFTQADGANMPLSRMLDLVHKRFRKIGYEILGLVWTGEVKESDHVSGQYHWHYHVGVALNRRMKIRGKGWPPEVLFEGLWGKRTEIEFIREDIQRYMAKYFAKCNYRVIGVRSYGRSTKFKLPMYAVN